MIRAVFYLVVAGAVWFAEAFLFTRFLAFSAGQTVLAAGFYVALYLVVVTTLIRAVARDSRAGDVARWRALSLAPMLAVIVGSFVSLPVLLVIAALSGLG